MLLETVVSAVCLFCGKSFARFACDVWLARLRSELRLNSLDYRALLIKLKWMNLKWLKLNLTIFQCLRQAAKYFVPVVGD